MRITEDIVKNAKNGIFKAMLCNGTSEEPDYYEIDNIKQLADSISVNGECYSPRGDDITEDNKHIVLADLAIIAQAGLSGNEKAPAVGFLDSKGEAIHIMVNKEMLEQYPQEIEDEPPQKPKFYGFKKIMRRLFGAFRDELREYDERDYDYRHEKAAYDKAVAECDADYEKRMPAFDRSQEASNKLEKELAAERAAFLEQYERETQLSADKIKTDISKVMSEDGVKPAAVTVKQKQHGNDMQVQALTANHH